MTEYYVAVTPSADRDLEDIFEYIADELQAPDTALLLIEKIYKALKSLSSMPFRHPLSKDPFLAKQGFRTFSVENYLVFYTVDKASKDVIVHRTLYEKRNYVSLFIADAGGD